MSYCVLVELYCDADGCHAGVEAHVTRSDARREAVKLGWQVRGRHLCPKHREKSKGSRRD